MLSKQELVAWLSSPHCILIAGFALIASLVIWSMLRQRAMRLEQAEQMNNFLIDISQRLPKTTEANITASDLEFNSRYDGETLSEKATWTLAGPIVELSFAESLDSKRFSEVVEQDAIAILTQTFDRLKMVADAAGAIKELRKNTTLIVQVSDRGQQLLNQGRVTFAFDRSGNILPQLKDGRNQIVEMLKAGPGNAGRLAQLSALVLAASHAVSSADIASQLKTIQTRLVALLELRRVDQAARLERIYCAAKELLIGPRTDLAEIEIWRLRAELRELRASWRRELVFNLGNIENPNDASYLAWLTTFTSTVNSRIHAQLTQGSLQLSFVEYSLRLDQALAISAGQQIVALASLEGELDELQNVSNLLDIKSDYLKQSSTQFSEAKNIVSALDDMIDFYRGLPAKVFSFAENGRDAAGGIAWLPASVRQRIVDENDASGAEIEIVPVDAILRPVEFQGQCVTLTDASEPIFQEKCYGKSVILKIKAGRRKIGGALDEFQLPAIKLKLQAGEKQILLLQFSQAGRMTEFGGPKLLVHQ